MHLNPYIHHNSHKHTPHPQTILSSPSFNLFCLLYLVKFLIRNKLPRRNLIDRGRGWAALITYLIVTSSIFYKNNFGRVWFEFFV